MACYVCVCVCMCLMNIWRALFYWNLFSVCVVVDDLYHFVQVAALNSCVVLRLHCSGICILLASRLRLSIHGCVDVEVVVVVVVVAAVVVLVLVLVLFLFFVLVIFLVVVLVVATVVPRDLKSSKLRPLVGQGAKNSWNFELPFWLAKWLESLPACGRKVCRYG
ncbi:unnamed protein product [Polarella glacialis]|uniref:Transmembrane protein n=1 Tax=Polarella glacialis TaxID=89957 RepID=A0A813KYY4_POLGL|nr:unnamed protein product [Polarella glacialis]